MSKPEELLQEALWYLNMFPEDNSMVFDVFISKVLCKPATPKELMELALIALKENKQ